MSRKYPLIPWAALVAALCGCQPSSDPPPNAATVAPTPRATPKPPGPPLVVSVVGEPSTFNPLVARDQAGLTVGGAIFDTLVRLDPSTGTVQPWLAKSWHFDVATNTYSVELRNDVSWHDGRPFSAADVTFTINAIHAVGDSPYTQVLRVDNQPINAEATGPLSLKFRLPRPHAPFPSTLAIPILPAHKFADLKTDSDADTIARRWGIDVDPSEVVGTGPFKLQDYKNAEEVVLTRHDSYWRHSTDGTQLPYLDRYVLRIAPDREQAKKWFLEGKIHIFSPSSEEITLLEEAKKEASFEIDSVGSDTGSLFLTFNRNPHHYKQRGRTDPRLQWFTDQRFLLAVAHSIDKDAIIQKALHGKGMPAVSYIAPSNRFYDTALTDYVFDQPLARRILQDAGYADRDADGVREDQERNPLKLTLTTNEGNPTRELIGKLLVEQLAAVGIQAILETLSFPTLFERLDATYSWDAMLIGFTGGFDPSSTDNLLRSSAPLHIWHPSQSEPATEWEAKVDSLLKLGAAELDPAKRRDTYWHIQEILHKELPMIQLARPTRFIAYSNDIENFRPTPWGFQRIEELRLREPTEVQESPETTRTRARRTDR